MRTKRLILFILMIGLGIGLGLLYGWVINPVQYVDTSLQSLRADYKADYVLMVAEIYQADQDLNQAIQRLSLLGSEDHSQIISQSITTAGELGYTTGDIDRMSQLAQALRTTGAEVQP